MKLSLHTAQASLRLDSSEPARCSRETTASQAGIVVPSDNLAILACGRKCCAPLGDNFGTHQATGVAHHLLFPVEGGSTYFLTIRHLADVGISGALPPALAFSAFSMLRLSTLPYGWGDHDWRGPSAQPFHVLHSIQDGFRSALLHRQSYEFAPGHVKRPGLDCLPFWPSLNQPRVALSL